MARCTLVTYPNIATLVHRLYCERPGQVITRECGLSSTRGNAGARSRRTNWKSPHKTIRPICLGKKTELLQSGQLTSSRTRRRVSAVHAGQAARSSAVDVAVRSLLLKKTRNLHESSKNSWQLEHPVEHGRCRSTLCIEVSGLAATETKRDDPHLPKCCPDGCCCF